MRRQLKNAQYFIHRYYEWIKLALLTTLIVLGVITLINTQASEGRRAENDERINRELIALSKAISRDQQKQHDHQDIRQACFFNLFISYTNSRRPITQEDVNRCRVAGDDSPVLVPTGEREPSSVIPAPATEQPTSQSGSARVEAAPAPRPENRQEPPREQPPAPEVETSLLEGIVNAIMQPLRR